MALPNNILIKAEKFLRHNVIITGGHFRIFFDKKDTIEFINPGTIMSFSYAIDLFLLAEEKGFKADLGILINDMGSSCVEEGCTAKTVSFSRQDYDLPAGLSGILKTKGLSEYPLQFFWEKHARNRGKKELLKILHTSKNDNLRDSILKIGSDGFFIEDPEYFGRIILTRTRGRDKYGTPACPLIMSGLNMIQSLKYERSINFYYIGEDNINNIPNHNAIEKGKRVTQLFESNIQVENLYFDSF